ncbi:MAG: DNA polymerase III subunit delta' [Nitrospirae bacterium]|nr:DNA polymerase III subunit delta' [Nitrospirota bacterium]
MAFRDVIGQKQALRILQGTIRKGRTPSSFMFSGDRGIGKHLAAVNYAKTVNCLQPEDFDCCDKCISCKKIAAGGHPDVASISPENDVIKIEAIRSAEEFIHLKTFEGNKKVLLVDDADAMNISAANAFLKTLEEPPSDSLIILITSEAGSLPDTIRSRCSNVVFRPLPTAECKRLAEAKMGASTELVLNLAGGRPGLCIAYDFAQDKKLFISSLQDIFSGASSKDIWKDKAEIRQWLDMAAVFIRDIVISKLTGSEKNLLFGNVGELRTSNNKPFAESAKKASLERLLETHQLLEKFKGLLDFNPNKSISWNYVSSLMKGCLD